MTYLPRFAPLALLLCGAPLVAQTPDANPPKSAPAAAPPLKPGTNRLPPEIAPALPPPADKDAGAPAQDVAAPHSASPAVPRKNEPARSDAATLLESLSMTDLQKIVPLLKAHYLQPAALSDVEVERATVQGLLDRLGPKVSLAAVSAGDQRPANPFKSEILESRIGYLRLGSIGDETLTKLDEALKTFSGRGLPAMVLDLRATAGGSDFDRAAEVCRRFCPKGKILFTIRQPDTKDQIFTSANEPLAHGILVVLTDAATSGSGEIIAGVLRKLGSAMVIGGKTKGEAAGFELLPLSNNTALRVPVAELVLPGDVDAVATGIEPDLKIDVSLEETRSVLREEFEKGVAPLVLEVERPRLNEAALVAGTNPDLDAMIDTQRSHGDGGKTALRDAVMERAVDFVTSIAIYQKGARNER